MIALKEPKKVDTAESEERWHSLPAKKIPQRLETDSARGLNESEATRRLAEWGLNELTEDNRFSWWSILARQFWDVLTLILAVAAVMSLFVGEPIDSITIMAIILLNGTLGFVQEWKAERALTALREMLSPTCTVIRSGVERVLDSRKLVPGDLVQLATGDRVPADLRIVRDLNVRIDESALTGESDSVSKSSQPVDAESSLAQQQSMAWMGTTVTNGRALGIVVATGPQTQFGRISHATGSIETESTPLQRKMGVLGRQLAVAAITIATIVAFVGMWQGNPWTEMLLTGVSLAVAVVPEGLPAVVTLTMAFGVRAMVRRRALLRRLQAAESLGAATVVCTDKTGTLTQNEMTVKHIWLPNDDIDVTGIGYDPAGHFEHRGARLDYENHVGLLRLLETGLHCNHASLHKSDDDRWHKIGEPTESALIVAGYKAWLETPTSRDLVAEFGFDSSRKRMTIVKRVADHLVAHVKGAPEVLLERCGFIQNGDEVHTMDELAKYRVNDATNEFASRGLRTLALARRELPCDASLTADEVESQLVLLGIVGMLDPPRPEVADAIAKAKNAGIRVLMITGDAAATAQAIAESIGITSVRTLTGQELEAMSESELKVALQDDVTFARTTPEHKLRIVTALQNQGHVVAMTGDGVNDAPALKKADIGVAMGLRGTDVAKGAADMVLTDDNFTSIIGAVEEGRRQYDNIQKFVRYLLSSNTGEVVAIFASILMQGPLILLPVQILWMNLITDGLSAVALGVEPAEGSVMRRPPREVQARVLDHRGIWMILLLGGYVGLATLGLFAWYLHFGNARHAAVAQTVAFSAIIVIQKVNVLNFRSLDAPLNAKTFWANPWVLIAILATLSIHVASVYLPVLQRALHTVPLRFSDWAVITLIAIPVFVVTELYKRVSYGSARRVERSV